MTNTIQLRPGTAAGFLPGSPWGEIQHQTVVTTGVIRVSTARHGGYWLDPFAWSQLLAAFPGFKPFAGAPWLEEDCDATAVILLWPGLFPNHVHYEVARALTAPGYTLKDGGFRRWLGTPAGVTYLRNVEMWTAENGDTWIRGGGCTHGQFWLADWYRVGRDRVVRHVGTKGYPEADTLTTAELDTLAEAGCEWRDGDNKAPKIHA